jgi:hypothetical protein
MKASRETAGTEKINQETPENREEVSQATMNYLLGFEKDLDEIGEWLLSVRPLIEKLGESHKQGNQAARRQAQNSLWQNYREAVWQKKLLLNTQNFQGAAQDQQQQAGLLERWESEIAKTKNPRSKKGEPEMPAIKDLAQTLYSELEQHWLTETLPENFYQFPFRISVWIERIGKAKTSLQSILKQVEVIKS